MWINLKKANVMKNPIAILLAGLALTSVSTLAKKPLDHDAFDSWQLVKNTAVSRDGQWAVFSVDPQEGDGVLSFANTRNSKRVDIPRGYKATVSADGRWGYALIKPEFAVTRQAKIDNKKDDEMPKDTLAIVDLKTLSVEKIPFVTGYKVPEDGSGWVAYLSCDTTLITPKALKDKEAGRPMVVRTPNGQTSKTLNWVKEYVFTKDGKNLAVRQKKQESDSLATDGIGYLTLADTAFYLIDRDRKFYGSPVWNEKGDRLAFTASNDSNDTGTKICELLIADVSVTGYDPKPVNVHVTEYPRINLALPHASDPALQDSLNEARRLKMEAIRKEGLHINQYSRPEFSHNGRRLVIGVAPYVAEDDTTLVDFEKADIDIWRWDAPVTPPYERKNLEKMRSQTFPVVIDLFDDTQQLLTTEPLVEVSAPDRWDADWALLRDASDSMLSHQWDYYAPEKISVINVKTGERREIGEAPYEFAELSPDGRYVVWFKDRDYFVYNIAKGETVNVSQKVGVPLWDEKDDHPMIPQPHGLAAWTKGDKALLVYDRYDIWQLDPEGKVEPVNLTRGEGRAKNYRYRYNDFDKDHRFLSEGDLMLLSVFDYESKKNGIATMKYGKPAVPELRTLEGNMFHQMRKAKDAEVYTYNCCNFSTSPNIFTSGLDFKKRRQLTEANPQMADYNWGTAELVKWYAYDGQESEGVLYKPEDFDPTKKYPMLCVFYETGSEELYRHYTMEPSWSWVNYPFYVSRGYIVFVPDIHYTSGVPGECAWNYVCSGAEELCKRYDWIDRDKIGIDGQSWGGYQTAYLITRTNMFACAGSGAPVANMTSAFGGIRWGSGSSRQAQYEMGQSRIGRNLWDAPELYIANSPVFHANRVETPLLIMHNDQDGAVPWYQGIELFMALRRLGKPVWMLQYNGEDHNIKERRNRKDITRRLQQFFDHYLKDEPMPEWMKKGIPMTRKGQEYGF